MNYKNLEYFELIDDKIRFLVIKSDNLKKIVEYINKNNIENVVIDSYGGFIGTDIDFLKSCPKIKRIFLAGDTYCKSGILHLKKLEYLIFANTPNSIIDLSKFKFLTHISFTFHKNWINLIECKSLKSIIIRKYPFENLINLSKLPNLNRLELIQSKIISLLGVEKMRLTKLEIHNASKLINISLTDKLPFLKVFHLFNCKKIENHEKIANATNLISLKYCNCGNIGSISFVSQLKFLKEFRFPKTNIIDGDLSHLEKIDIINFNDKKHYSHKYKELMLERIESGRYEV